MDIKPYKVGLIKSVVRDYERGQIRGIIETVNDNENEKELPFLITNASLMNLKEGKMVKFVKETGTLISRAVDVDKL